MPKTGENIYKRKDGRWEARFISGRKPDGCAKYTSVYARTYAAAKAKLEDRKRMIVSRPAGSCRLTVKELFVWYLSQAEIKPSTRARYVFLIEHHILPELGSIFVVSLTAKQLSDFLSQKRQSGRLHGGGLSAKSVRDIGVLIKAALRFASAEYHFYCDALNTKLDALKEALKGDNTDAIKSAEEDLTNKFYEVSQKIYEATQGAQGPQPGAAPGADAAQGGNDAGYTDADYTEVDDN